MGGFKKLVWAMDLIGGEEKVNLRTAKAIEQLTKGQNTSIEPVCVVVPPTPILGGARTAGGSREDLLVAKKAFRALKSKVKLKGLKQLNVRRPSLLQASAVNIVLDFAKKAKADAIVLNTHARTGIKRLIMGSFAEALCLKSPIPVLTFNPHSTRKAKACKQILFSTDLSLPSLSEFASVLKLAKSLKSQVTIYHKVEAMPLHGSPTLVGVPIDENVLETDLRRRAEKLEEMKLQAIKLGVRSRVIMDKKKGDAATGVIKTAQRVKADLIALVAHTGPMATVLLGSVSRNILREAKIPVWVLHPPPKKKKLFQLGFSPGLTKKDLSEAFGAGLKQVDEKSTKNRRRA